MFAETIRKQNVTRDQLTIHADRGSSMTSKPVAFLLADLGVTKSHCRPRTSNDNPYSESQFRTLKYRPDFPDRFASIEDSRVFCDRFFGWSRAPPLRARPAHPRRRALRPGPSRRAARAAVLDAAYAASPERFVRKPPEPPKLPQTAWINKPTDNDSEDPTH